MNLLNVLCHNIFKLNGQKKKEKTMLVVGGHTYMYIRNESLKKNLYIFLKGYKHFKTINNR